LVAFIQEEERGDAVDLRGEEDLFAAIRDDMPSTRAIGCANTLINAKKMNVILDA
jgi:hypothetical protein